jgi:hypothetical protein
MAEFITSAVPEIRYQVTIHMSETEAMDLINKLSAIKDQYKPTHIIGDLFRAVQKEVDMTEPYNDYRL